MIFKIESTDGHTHYWGSTSEDKLRKEFPDSIKTISEVSEKEAREVKVELYDENNRDIGKQSYVSLWDMYINDGDVMMIATTNLNYC